MELKKSPPAAQWRPTETTLSPSHALILFRDREATKDSEVSHAKNGDLTWLFWTKLCEKLSLERSFGYAEEEVQR